MPKPLPEHITWLIHNRGAALEAVLEAQGAGLPIDEALAIMMDADPSPGGHSVQWLCDTLIAGGVLWEDMAAGAGSKAAETLRWFGQHRRELPAGNRNLQDHVSLASIYSAIQPLLAPEPGHGGEPGGRALRRAQRLAAREQSIMVHESPELIVAVPTTKLAAQWWGRGTRWCTAADEDNRFESYHEDSPLVVVVLPGVALQAPGVALQAPGVALQSGGKLQLCAMPGGDLQFMDANDEKVSPELVAQHWRVLEPLVTWALEQGWPMTRWVPHEHLHGHLALLVVSSGPGFLEKVAPQHRSYEICRAALNHEWDALLHVPGHLQDMDMCKVAVGHSGYALKHVLQSLRTPELCDMALDNGLDVLRHVPQHLHTVERLMRAVARDAFALHEIDRNSMSADDYRALCMLAVRRDGSVLRDIHELFWDEELLVAAVSSSPYALEDIPDAMRTPRVLMASVTRDGGRLEFMSPGHRTPEICARAVAQNGRALKHVPPNLVSREMCLAAVGECGYALQYVPKTWRDAEICLAAVQRSSGALAHIPEHIINFEMCLQAVGNNSNIISQCPKFIMNADLNNTLWRVAILNNPWVIHLMEKADMTRELAMLAVQNEPMTLHYIPHKDQTHEICMAAVGQKSYALRNVAPHLLAGVEAALAALPPPSPPPTPAWMEQEVLPGLAQCLDAHMAGLNRARAVYIDPVPLDVEHGMGVLCHG